VVFKDIRMVSYVTHYINETNGPKGIKKILFCPSRNFVHSRAWSFPFVFFHMDRVKSLERNCNSIILCVWGMSILSSLLNEALNNVIYFSLSPLYFPHVRSTTMYVRGGVEIRSLVSYLVWLESSTWTECRQHSSLCV